MAAGACSSTCACRLLSSLRTSPPSSKADRQPGRRSASRSTQTNLENAPRVTRADRLASTRHWVIAQRYSLEDLCAAATSAVLVAVVPAAPLLLHLGQSAVARWTDWDEARVDLEEGRILQAKDRLYRLKPVFSDSLCEKVVGAVNVATFPFR